MEVKFTNQDLELAIEQGIFEHESLRASPADVILFFENWATIKAKEAHRNARHEACDIIDQHTHSQERVEMEIDGEIHVVEQTRLIRNYNTPSVVSQIMNIKF